MLLSVFLHGRVSEAAEKVSVGFSMDTVLLRLLVELLVDLVEAVGLARESMSGCSVLASAEERLPLW